MTRQFTGKTHEGIRKVKRANGDIYVYRRITVYDQKTRKTKTLKNELIGKIPAGKSEMVPTRPKKQKTSDNDVEQIASRKHVGATDILDWVAKASGIDEDLLAAFPEGGDAAKIASIARYWVATDGQSLPRMESWQMMHRIPYESGISEGVYGSLFQNIGVNEDGVQAYFSARSDRLDGKDTIAFDSTTVSTYSTNQIEARYGFNKDADGLPTIKLLTLYSVNSHEPMAFCKQPGNLSDVVCIENAIRQIQCLNTGKPLVVTDNGYFSWNNVTTFARKSMKFLTRIECSSQWIRKIIDESKEDFTTLASLCPFDNNIHGIKTMIQKDLVWERKRGRGQKPAGAEEIISKRLYLYIFHNRNRVIQDEQALEKTILELKAQVEADETEFTDKAKAMIDKYLIVKRNGRTGSLHVNFNEEAYKEARRYVGYFALLSNEPLELYDALKKYRMREKIEEMFRTYKNDTDGYKPRVWYSDRLRGRQFVQFIALGYRCFLEKSIARVKETLKKDIATFNQAFIKFKKEYKDFDKRMTEWKRMCREMNVKPDIDQRKKLLLWLDDHTLNQILDWYECVEMTTVKTPVAERRWSTEITTRDTLFLSELGVLK